MNLFLHTMLIYVTAEVITLRPTSSMDVSIVTTGFEDRQRMVAAPITAAGVYAAISDNQSPDDFVSLSQVTLQYRTTEACNAAGMNFDVVSNFYYSKKWTNESMMILITPGCGDSLILATLAREWNVFIISTSAVYAETQDREKYPTFISASSIQTSVLVEAVFSLMEYYQWTTISVIYDTSSLPSYYELASAMSQQRQALFRTIVLELYPIASSEKSWSPAKLFLSIRSTSRVIILSMHPTTVRKSMLVAHAMGMTTGEYAFLTPEAIRSYNNGNLTWENHDDNDLLVFEAYRTLLQVAVCPRNHTGRNERFLEYLADVSVNKYNITFQPGDQQPAEVTITAYQSVEMFEQVVQEMLINGSDFTNVPQLTKRFLNRNFDLSGGNIYIDSKGQRRNDHCVNDLNPQTGQFEVLAVLRYDARLGQTYPVPGKYVDWPTVDHVAPLNEPVCGYSGKKLICMPLQEIATNAAVGATCATVVLCTMFTLIARRIRKHSTFEEQDWMLDESFLTCTQQPNLSRTTRETLRVEEENDMEFLMQSMEWTYKGELVSVKRYEGSSNALRDSKKVKIFVELRKLYHRNIVRFIGVCTTKTDIRLVSEFCSRNSLSEFLTTSRPTLFDWDLKCSFISDAIEAIAAIHGSFFKRHGNLRLSTYMVDSRFTLKIAELGYADITAIPVADFRNNAGPEADIYSLGVIIGLLFKTDQSADSINSNGPNILLNSGILMTKLADDCTNSVGVRPSIKTIRMRFIAIVGNKRSSGILANILNKMQEYAQQLEAAVKDRTSALLKEKQANENLLLEILPKILIGRLSSGYDVPAETFSSCTIFFCNIYNFTDFVAISQAFEIVQFLNSVFALYDELTTNFQVVSGVPIRNSDLHAREICKMALQFSKGFATHVIGILQDLQFIAGAHSGPCVAGVIGSKRPRYCLFGDTVNIASRMVSHGEPTRIHISISTVKLLNDVTDFYIRERGMTALKGRGELQTFWLEDPP